MWRGGISDRAGESHGAADAVIAVTCLGCGPWPASGPYDRDCGVPPGREIAENHPRRGTGRKPGPTGNGPVWVSGCSDRGRRPRRTGPWSCRPAGLAWPAARTIAGRCTAPPAALSGRGSPAPAAGRPPRRTGRSGSRTDVQQVAHRLGPHQVAVVPGRDQGEAGTCLLGLPGVDALGLDQEVFGRSAGLRAAGDGSGACPSALGGPLLHRGVKIVQIAVQDDPLHSLTTNTNAL